MLRKVLTALAIPVMGLALAGAVAAASPKSDACCRVTNDAGQLVCTITGQVLDKCCCE